jgi:transposase
LVWKYFLQAVTMNEIQKYNMMLRDDQWQTLEPLLIGKQSDPGISGKNNRLFFEAVLWIALNHNLWRDLPPQFGKLSTVYMRFRRWNECDFWRQLAQSKIEDRELLTMLDQIVDYGDLYTRRIGQRQARKAKKAAYKSIASAADRNNLSAPSDESTLHWVGLVTSKR